MIVIGGLTYGIDGYPLLEPDEGRNAEVAREMASTNNYIVPQLNNLPYADKPFLYFGATAVAIEVFGPTVFAARIVPLLFTLATLLLLAWLGNREYGPVGGVIVAVATGSMPLTLGFARTVIMDSAMTTFVIAAIVCFYCATETDPATARDRASRWAVAGWLMLVLGVFTKGPIALGIPLMVTIPYAFWRKRARIVFDAVGLLAFTAAMVPWLAIVSREIPGFLEYALVTETIRRFTTTELQRAGPWWYFLPILLAGALPWSLVPLVDWRRSIRRPDARAVFALIWLVVPLIFFSLSQSKRPQYLVPVVPAFALLVARRWAQVDGALPGVRGAAVGLVGFASVIAASPLLLPSLLDLKPDVLASVRPTAWWLSTVAAASGVSVWLARRHRASVVALMTLPVALIPLISMNLMRAIGNDRSSFGLATAIQPALTPSTEVVAVHTYPLSLPFYIRRPLILSTHDGSELTSNYIPPRIDQFTRQPGSSLRPHDWWIDALTTCARSRIFVAASTDHATRQLLGQELPLIVETTRLAAYGPCRSTDLAIDRTPVAPHHRSSIVK